MTRQRKVSTQSADEIARVASASVRVLEPPDHIPLDDEEMVFFDEVIAEFAKADWSPHQISLACFLARAMANLNREQQLLQEEGALSENARGTPMVNPRRTVVQMEATTILSLRRSLQLTTVRVGVGANTYQKQKMTQKMKEVEKGVQDVMDDEDDLLAMPSGVPVVPARTNHVPDTKSMVAPPWAKGAN